MRDRARFTVTMDPRLLAQLDLASGSVPRSRMIEASVKLGLELLENVKRMKSAYDGLPIRRRRNLPR